MADDYELCLVLNRGGSMPLVHEGRAYTLKHTDEQKKHWKCSKACPEFCFYSKEPTKINVQRMVIRGCRGIVSTNLEVTEVIRLSEHAESCPANPRAFYHHQQLAEWRRLVSEDTRIPMIGINSKFRSKQQLSNILRPKLIHPSCLLKYALQADGPRKISVFGTGHSP
ncbi:hypothetical protein T08_14305 [Trichinella sp. T8]|nr:hypothetical protein T08_14305 [Trichinella sp. T8]